MIAPWMIATFVSLSIAWLALRDTKRSCDNFDRSLEIVRSWKRKAASFHRRSQQYESQCCRLRRDLCGETIRANWWKSEATRLGWKPTNEERGQ